MKKILTLIVAGSAVRLVSLNAADAAAPESGPAPAPRKEIRVITAAAPGDRPNAGPGAPTGPAPRGMVRIVGPAELESVTFLGVETGPVSATLSAQLTLPEGSGLVVSHVIPKSPAAGALQVHDILLKLDEQILIEQRQLAVLIRHKKEGDEVTLTFLRAGKQATAKIKLGKHDAPKLSSAIDQTAPGTMRERMLAAGGFDLQAGPGEGAHSRDDINRVLAMIDAAGGVGQRRVELSRVAGPGDRNVSVTINTGTSRLVANDERGSLELTINQGRKDLVARNAKGEQVFAGAVNTPEERKALPEDVRARLEKLEDLKQFSFRTDGEFQGAETKIIRPRGQGISFPREAAPRPPAQSPLFF